MEKYVDTITDQKLIDANKLSDLDSIELSFLMRRLEELSEKISRSVADWRIVLSLFLLGLTLPLAICVSLSSKLETRSFNEMKAIVSPSTANAKDKSTIMSIDDVRLLVDGETLSPEVNKSASESIRKYDEKFDEIMSNWFLSTVICIFFLPFAYIIWNWTSRVLLRKERGNIEYKISQLKARSLQDHIGLDFFTTLVKINFKYLDQYYYQTQEQANKSFKLAVYSSVVGAVIIAAGVITVFIKKDANVGSLTTAAGVVSQFIGAVFFYLYNQTIQKMGEYHQKLVLTQNIGIALKITESLPVEEQTNAQQLFVKQLTENINYHLSGNESHSKLESKSQSN